MRADEAAPDWPPLASEEILLLAQRVPALRSGGEILWHSPRPFSAAARVRTSGQELFVKRHSNRVRDAAALREEHAFLSYLRAHGASVPNLLADEEGDTAISLGDWTYEVHGQAPGLDIYRDLHSWMAPRSGAHARTLGAALACLHLAAQGFDAPARRPRPLQAGTAVGSAPDLALGLAQFLAGLPATRAYLAACNGEREIVAALSPWHRAAQPFVRELPELWVHNDWHASNLFWSADVEAAQVTCAIDFGLSNRGLAIADIATALERNTISWLDQGQGKPIARWDLAQALLEGYESQRALSATERAGLPFQMALAHVEYALSEVEYFQGIVGNADNAHLAYPEFLLGHVRWFESDEGRDYLARLRAFCNAPH
jgi:Ser/Thr protein kinase RdoA (MazF antagonist)